MTSHIKIYGSCVTISKNLVQFDLLLVVPPNHDQTLSTQLHVSYTKFKYLPRCHLPYRPIAQHLQQSPIS